MNLGNIESDTISNDDKMFIFLNIKFSKATAQGVRMDIIVPCQMGKG